MPRQPKPWYDAGKDLWRVYIRRKRHDLVKGRENEVEAKRLFHLLMAEQLGPAVKTAPSSLTVVELCNLRYLHLLATAAPSTTADARPHLAAFATAYQHDRAAEVTPAMVEAWISGHASWGQTTRGRVIAIIKATFRWAWQEGRLEHDPLARLKAPTWQSRVRAIGSVDWAKIQPAIKSADGRDLLMVISETGARPDEIARLEAKHLRPNRIAELPGKNTRKTGRSRIVRFTALAWEAVQKRAESRPVGYLFRTHRGAKWSRTAIQGCCWKASAASGIKFTAYDLRHGFITDALERGLSDAQIAELVDTSPALIRRTYGHLRHRHDAMRSVLDAVRPAAPQSPGRSARKSSAGQGG